MQPRLTRSRFYCITAAVHRNLFFDTLHTNFLRPSNSFFSSWQWDQFSLVRKLSTHKGMYQNDIAETHQTNFSKTRGYFSEIRKVVRHFRISWNCTMFHSIDLILDSSMRMYTKLCCLRTSAVKKKKVPYANWSFKARRFRDSAFSSSSRTRVNHRAGS